MKDEQIKKCNQALQCIKNKLELSYSEITKYKDTIADLESKIKNFELKESCIIQQLEKKKLQDAEYQFLVNCTNKKIQEFKNKILQLQDNLDLTKNYFEE